MKDVEDWKKDFERLRADGKPWFCLQCTGDRIREVQPSSDASGHSATGICFDCDPQASSQTPMGRNGTSKWRRVAVVDDKSRLVTKVRRSKPALPEPMFTEGWVKDGSGHERYVERPVSDDLDEYL